MSRIQVRRGTSTQWTTSNPVLAQGEPGYETNTGKFKIGNGSTAWNSLAYTGTVTSVAGRIGDVTLNKSDVGLSSVDNTADADKNVLSATRLTTARTINGVSFDGTQDINIAAGLSESLISINSSTTLASTSNTEYFVLCNHPTISYKEDLVVSNFNDLSNIGTLGGAWNSSWNAATSAKIQFSSTVVKYGNSSVNVFNEYGNESAFIQFPQTIVPGTDDYTIDFWLYMVGTIYTSNACFSFNGASQQFSIGNSNSDWQLSINNTVKGTGSIGANNSGWKHIAVSRSSGTTRYFINGVLQSTFADTTNMTGGQLKFSNSQFFVDDFRYSNYARYTAAFTPPTSELWGTGTPLYTATLPSAVGSKNIYNIKNNSGDAIGISVPGTTSTRIIRPSFHAKYISNGTSWVNF